MIGFALNYDLLGVRIWLLDLNFVLVLLTINLTGTFHDLPVTSNNCCK